MTAKARLDNHPLYQSIRRGRGIQKILAKKLHEEAGVKFGPCGIDEIKQFQSTLTGYQIKVVSKEYFNTTIYSGPVAGRKIYLYHHDDHYDVLTSMATFLNRSYYCDTCQKGYDHKENHECNDVCHLCKKIHPKETHASLDTLFGLQQVF